ncbi:MAG: Fe2+-dependent dioxygenase [Cyanobacteriota bacterium]|nr:Fe2+-dependent dioxygenase [Cyanobacteriota bacterium]
MIVAIDEVLSAQELGLLLERLDCADWIDGKKTAGWSAKLVKNNLQLARETADAKNLQKRVTAALERNALFQATVQPRQIHSLLFSRYDVGMSYGAHVDNALMKRDRVWRADISFTLFLSSPSSYGGGELVIEESDGDRAYKLEAGSALVYPSSSLHRVEPVTAGRRWAAVGWVQSWVREERDREILFDLDTVRRSIFAKEGKTLEFDLLSKTYSNLLRQWAE